MKRWYQVCTVLLAMLTTAALAQTSAAPALHDLSNKTISLQQYKGRLVLLNFWASWCAPCRQEMPDLDALQAQYDPKKFAIVGVAADELSEVQAFLTKIKVRYDIAVGAPDQVFAWSAQLGNQSEGLPFSVLMDGNGKIRWQKSGGRIEAAQLKPVVDKLLSE